jgi:hypothetical protein
MASDVVFTEGGEATAAAAVRVDTAVAAQERAFDAFESGRRRLQAYAAVGAGMCVLLVVAVLLPTSSPASTSIEAALAGEQSGRILPRETPREQVATAPASGPDAGPSIRETAVLCTDLAQVRDAEELTRLLGRAAALMDASGIVVWLGGVGGTTLRPVLAHGYTPDAIARMSAVPRSADNAAAAAYRTGCFQVVRAWTAASDGAVVAPLLSPEGCIGAFTAELKHGKETTDVAQAVAMIVAAQFASVLASSAPAADTAASATRLAAG